MNSEGKSQSKGDALYMEEDYQGAVEVYDSLLSTGGVASPGLTLLHRGMAKIKLGKYSSSISDLIEARIRDKELESVSLEFEARALFYSEDFKMATDKFNEALEKCEERRRKIEPWIYKCKKEIEGPSQEEAKRAVTTSGSVTKKQQVPPQITKIDYYQNKEDVIVTIIFKPKLTEAQKKMIGITLGVEEVVIECEELALVKRISLFSSIQPAQSTFRFGVNLELKLRKHMEGMSWMKLEKEQVETGGVVLRDNIMKEAPPPSYPSSSKKQSNWNTIDKEMEKELKKEKPEGEAAMMGMFRDIFS